MYRLILLVVLPALAFAGRAFPTGVERRTEEIFQKVNPRIKWDNTNYLVDQSGPFAVCANADKEGVLDVGEKVAYSKLYGANGVGGLISGTRTTGTTVTPTKNDIYTIINSWPKRSPFVDQIKEADTFGCGVQPGCNGRTIVVCLFSPKLTLSGDEGDQGDESQNLEVRAIAYTPEEYAITENEFQKINPKITWDRSHFLENLSGSETSCSMIGKSYWDAKKAKEFAAARGMNVEMIFGWTERNGNTDEAIREIARGWLKSEWKQIQSAEDVGCSLAIGCNGSRDILVAACLVNPGV